MDAQRLRCPIGDSRGGRRLAGQRLKDAHPVRWHTRILPAIQAAYATSTPARKTGDRQRVQRSSRPIGQPRTIRDYQYYSGTGQPWDLPTGLAATWLGTSSGAPTRERNISCTLVRTPGSICLVDAGEGSFRQFQLTGLDLQQVDTVFITHMHGDHCFGLGGLLIALSAAKQGLTDPQDRQVMLVGPPGLLQLVQAVMDMAGAHKHVKVPVYVMELVERTRGSGWARSSGSRSGKRPWKQIDCPGELYVNYCGPDLKPPRPLSPQLAEEVQRMGLNPLDFRRTEQGYGSKTYTANEELVWSIPTKTTVVKAAQLQHRVPCFGYVFQERQAGGGVQTPGSDAGTSSDSEEVADGLSGNQVSSSSRGEAAEAARSSSVSSRRRKVVILGDTMNSRAIIPWSLGADLLSHEATFSEGMEKTAYIAQHSTAWMAGQCARAVRAQLLVLTHFSARFSDGLENGGKGGFRSAEEGLRREAVGTYGRETVLMAEDLLTVHIPIPDQ